MGNKNNKEITELSYHQVGSTWIIDSTYLFLIFPVAIIGTLLNILCLYIISQKIDKNKHNITHYGFLKVYFLNSIFVCSIGFYAFSYSPRFIGIMIDYFSKFFRCYLTSFLAVTIDYHCNVINIIILFGRLSIFIKKLKVFKNLNPLVITILTFFLCTSINLPSLFRYQINNDFDPRTSSNRTNQTICMPWFLHSNYITLSFTLFFRDLVTLAFELVGTIISCMYFRKFYINKKKVLFESSVHPKSDFNEKKLSNKEDERHLILFTFILTTISLACHVSLCLTWVFLIKYSDHRLVGDYSVAFVCCLLMVKYSANFFILYYFDKNFKKGLHLLIKKN